MPVDISTVIGTECPSLRAERRGGVLIVVLDDSNTKFNTFTWQRLEDLAVVMRLLRRDSSVRSVLLTGKGRFFSAGGSFEVFESLRHNEGAERIGLLCHQLYDDLLAVPAPIVCALNGPAIGVGCSIALLSDVVFASSTATLSDPHVSRGVTAGDGPAIWSLYLGPVRAKRYLLTGEVISADEAKALGMYTFVYPAAEVFDRALEYATDFAAGAPNAIAHTKALCNRYIKESLDRSFDVGFGLELLDFRSDDHREAMAAFREHRQPHFGSSNGDRRHPENPKTGGRQTDAV